MNETGRRVREQSPTRAASPTNVFAACSILGYAFVPRIRDLPLEKRRPPPRGRPCTEQGRIIVLMLTAARVSGRGRGELEEAAEGVGQAHLLRGAAVRREEGRAGDDRGHAAGARGGDVEAVQAVEELHSPRRFVGGRGGHRVDHDRRLLSLELVDRAHPRVGGQRRPQDGDVCVVGGHDQDVVKRQPFLDTLPVDPGGPGGEQLSDQRRDAFGFLCRGVRVAGMRHGNET